MNQSTLQSRILFPDPFSPRGVEFELPEKCSVTIRLIDNDGVEILKVRDGEEFEAGTHSIQLDTHCLAAGAYFCRISANGPEQQYLDIKKLIVRRT